MLSGKIFLCAVLVAALRKAESASLPLIPPHIGLDYEVVEEGGQPRSPLELMVREGVPPPLCVGMCREPPAGAAGPVCALNAAGTARTFATLCELEAVSCRESTYYAITNLGEC